MYCWETLMNFERLGHRIPFQIMIILLIIKKFKELWIKKWMKLWQRDQRANGHSRDRSDWIYYIGLNALGPQQNQWIWENLILKMKSYVSEDLQTKTDSRTSIVGMNMCDRKDISLSSPFIMVHFVEWHPIHLSAQT